MYARVTTIVGSPADADAGIENFRAEVVPFARDQGRGAILLVDRQSGEALRSRCGRTSRRYARPRRAPMRCARMPPDRWAAESPTVGRYEVAVFEV